MKNDIKQIDDLAQLLIEGWNRGDGEMCSRPFAVDADFTAINGLRAKGRELIARGYNEILSTIYQGTTNSAKLESVRFLSAGVAVADVTFRFTGELRPFGVERTSAGLVCTKEEGAWSIVVFRNMVPFARPAPGPIETELLAAAL